MTTPITDQNAQQVETVFWFRTRQAMGNATKEVRIDSGRRIINRLRDLGWEIEPPKPRYATRVTSGSAYEVIDTRTEHVVAVFYGPLGWGEGWRGRHPTAEAAAQAEATRLNEQVT